MDAENINELRHFLTTECAFDKNLFVGRAKLEQGFANHIAKKNPNTILFTKKEFTKVMETLLPEFHIEYKKCREGFCYFGMAIKEVEQTISSPEPLSTELTSLPLSRFPRVPIKKKTILVPMSPTRVKSGVRSAQVKCQ